MADSENKFDAFVKEHVKRFKDVVPLLKAVKRRFPTREWPAKDPTKEYQCISRYCLTR